MSDTTLYHLDDYAALTVGGDDASTFLQGQVCGDVNVLTPNSAAMLTACCDPNGRILANFYLALRENNYVLVLPQSMRDSLRNHLQRYAVFSKVTLKDNNAKVYGCLSTPDTAATYFALPDALQRGILLKESSITPVTTNDWCQRDIDAGIALVTPSTQKKFLPQMLNLEKFHGLSFKKGCYVGQEIIARTQHLGKLKRHLYRGRLSNPVALNAGDDLKNSQNETIGTVIVANECEFLAVMQDQRLDDANQINTDIITENLTRIK